MRVLVLGVPVVEVGGQGLRPVRRAARVLLGMLALRANTPIPVDVLVDGLWPVAAPPSAAANLRSHVADLRRLLGRDSPVGIVAGDGGYLLRAPVDAVDASLFRALLADGRRYLAVGDHLAAGDCFGRATELWRGPLMAGVPVPDLLSGDVAELEEARVAAVEELMEARLAIGAGAELVPLLKGLVVDHLFRERLWGQLMRALHTSGRMGEALEVYRRLADLLRRELGARPGPEVTRIVLRITGGDRLPQASVPR